MLKVSSTKLETVDDGLPFDERDLMEGNMVVWLHNILHIIVVLSILPS